MTDNEYYNLDRFSFSYLNGLMQEQNGTKKAVKTSDFLYSFGTLFHLAALEPEKYLRLDHPLKRSTSSGILPMLNALNKSSVIKYLRNHPNYEVEKITLFELEGLPFKMKTDIEVTDLIIDIKTTKMKSEVQFAEELADRNSWMQAGLYMQGTGKRSFLFIGVQSIPPYQLYFIHSCYNEEDIKMGMEKAKTLIRTIK